MARLAAVGKSDDKNRIHPYFLAGLEMQNYLEKTKTTEEQCARVVVKNKKNAFNNPMANYEANVDIDDVMKSEYLFKPLKKYDIAPNVDGAICFVLADEKTAKTLSDDIVYLSGFGYNSETPWLSTRGMDADYAKKAATMAFKLAGITEPRKELCVYPPVLSRENPKCLNKRFSVPKPYPVKGLFLKRNHIIRQCSSLPEGGPLPEALLWRYSRALASFRRDRYTGGLLPVRTGSVRIEHSGPDRSR